MSYSSERFWQDKSPQAYEGLMQGLPRSIRGANDVGKAIHRIVRATTIGQTLKGVLTSGTYKSAIYTLRKIGKRLA